MAKAAEPLADDAAFLRKMKPTLVLARFRGEAPQNGNVAIRAHDGDPAPTARAAAEEGEAEEEEVGRRPEPDRRRRGCLRRRRLPRQAHRLERTCPPKGLRTASLGESAKQIAEHASALARLELRLAALEMGKKAKALAFGVALALAALLLFLYALGFGLAAIAAAIPLSTWASLLIVTGGLLVVIAILGFFAVSAFKRGAPPVPEQAIEEAKLTSEAIKAGNGGS